ncbi:MAG: phage tail protein [Sphingomonadales bacterium]|nr:MAG: phage tail protein [Sphingomonadales bacterium]
MAQPYVGEIRMFAGNFAPAGWMFCEGQLLPISENETLFQLVGTTYGGDGQETFSLPDLRGRVPIHMGTRAGITYSLSEASGVESVTLTSQQIPSHTHPMLASSGASTTNNPGGNILGASPSVDLFYGASPDANLAPTAVTSAGGSQPHDNMQPYLCVDFIISLFGVFPSPN